jgi:hypothetical protein
MEDVYVRLQKHLDTFVFRVPESEATLEVLKIRFMPEEAEIALLLDRVPKDVSTFAQSSGMAEDGLRSILEKMADKALVYKQKEEKNGILREVYSLQPTVVAL